MASLPRSMQVEEAGVAPAIVDQGPGARDDQRRVHRRRPGVRTMDVTVKGEVDMEVGEQGEHVARSMAQVAVASLRPGTGSKP